MNGRPKKNKWGLLEMALQDERVVVASGGFQDGHFNVDNSYSHE